MSPIRPFSAVSLLAVLASLSASALAAGPTASSYFGGSGDDSIEGVAITDDGSIIIAGNSTSTSLFAQEKKLEAGDGFVARLNRDGTKVVWLSRLGHLATAIDLTKSGDPVVATGSRLVKLSLADGALATDAELGGTVAAFDVGADERVAAVVGTDLVVRAADFKTESLRKGIGRSHPWSVAFAPDGATIYVSGDTNAGNCPNPKDPYRSPFLFGFDAAGARVSTFLDPTGAVACGQYSLQADSFFQHVTFDSTGALWLTGASDGGNTVLGRDATDLAKPSPALTSACYKSACYGWKGAAKPGFLGRMNAARDNFDKATFMIGHFSVEHEPCSCDIKNQVDGSTRPNSAGLDFVFTTSKGTVIGAGSSAWHFPSKNAWYPAAAYTAGYPAVVGELDANLSSMTMATMLPGTGSTKWAAYRGGRLVVVGGAANNSAWTPPAGQESYAQASITPLPAGAALQGAYGGGAKDGFVYVACVTDDAECGAPPPPVTGTGGAGNGTGSTGNVGTGSTGNVGTGSTGNVGTGSTGNVAGAGSGAEGNDTSADGCGCSVPVRRGSSAALVALLAGLALASRRRSRA